MESIILAIESSCDETAVAIIQGERTLLANIVSSQIKVHESYGGVVPEIASRLHVENISFVLEEAINQAGIDWQDIDAIAVTQGPGLVGSLHVGMQAAKTLALMLNKPLIMTHHIAGHIYGASLVAPMKFPLIALVVSGGHTELVYMEDHLSFKIVGTTHDDAIGEAYDKVARVLGLPYPGGPQIDRLAKEGNPVLPLPKLMQDGSLDFSFSGLKSAVINLVHKYNQRGETINEADLAASFQETALDSVVSKTIQAAKQYDAKQILVVGGVAANQRLRILMQERVARELSNVEVLLPPLWCCTDNAAMIGAVAHKMYERKQLGSFKDAIFPSKSL